MTVNLGLFARCLLLFLSSGAQERRSTERNYYVGIVEDFWDYAPSGKNLLNGKSIESDEHARVFLESGPHRIGRVYKKAMFREFTDASYSSQVPRPKWLGFLGPILRAEVDDVIVVHLKNFASRNFTMHPHGLFYEKNAEGAFYPDGTSNALKQDDSVPPGGSYTYRWEVKPEFAPTDDDSNCLTWIYHSHLETPKDIASGLIGPLLTCKKGTLKQMNGILVRTDVDKDVFLMFNVVDENLSWYLNENIQRLSDPDGVDTEDPDFEESNLMHSINGFTYGNLPGIQMCQHRTVSWHLFGIGNEVDIHSAFFHGNTLLDRGHRTDTISLFPATFVTAEMVPLKAGKWLLACQVNDHLQAGMQAFYEVKPCASEGSSTASGGVVRDFYLAAEKVLWNYAPSEKDLINNVPLIEADSASEVFFGTEGGRIGGSYFKVMYREYTDNTFTTLKSAVHSPAHLGILGPVLRAEVGDTLRVTFMNRAEGNFSIQPHGLHYEKHFQGTSYMDGVNKPGSHVGQGETFTYIWQVLEGPSSSDTPCIPYLYYSATDPTKDTNSGLVGPLLICRKGVLAENGIQKGVDKEFFLLFSVMDENLSWYLDENIERSGINTEEENEDFEESNKMHAINGFMYGNLMGLEMCVGDKVMWYTFGLGTEADIHGVYFEGNTFKKQSTTRDTLSLFPHTTAAVSMQPNSPGVYEVSCRTTDHFSAGMRQKYKVNLCPGKTYWHKYTTPRRTVQYFIGAEEIVWDYSPDRQWEFEKHHTTAEDSPGNIFVVRGKNRIGSRYKKVVYREYTDETFKIQKERHPDEQHLGIMGPIIKGEVGEEIVITFKNKASRPYSISPHGVKASGAHIPVAPGHIIELTWDIPESSGPGVTDPNCISYAYYSSVNFIKDLYSGLLGPLVICRPGTLKRGKGSERQRRDIAKEFALLFMIYDENQSWYLDDNIKTYLGIDPEIFTPDEDFEESNLMHGINGKLYGNLHGLVMTQGQKVDWYLLGMGNEVDLHTVHFHAEAFTYKTDRVHRSDVFDLFPGTFQTVEMVVGNPGTWLLHCHVSDHIHAGMETTFTINERLYSQGAPRAEVSISMLILSLAFGLSGVARLY